MNLRINIVGKETKTKMMCIILFHFSKIETNYGNRKEICSTWKFGVSEERTRGMNGLKSTLSQVIATLILTPVTLEMVTQEVLKIITATETNS